MNLLIFESWQNVSEKRHVSENLLLFAFLYFTSNFDIIPYKSYPNNDMGCKSRPKLGCSQLTPDYATGKYLLILMRISKSGNQFQKIYSLHIFLTHNLISPIFPGIQTPQSADFCVCDFAFYICFF